MSDNAIYTKRECPSVWAGILYFCIKFIEIQKCRNNEMSKSRNLEITKQRHISLHLPTGWNRATTEELEAIAAAIVEEQAAVGRYRPFLWERVKLHIVLAVNRLSVLSSGGADDVFIVQRGGEEPFPVSTGQLASLCERLNWLTDEKAAPMLIFPYPAIELQGSRFKVQGPPPLLDGYTWREYRWLTDWMQEYIRLSNARRDASLPQREFLAVLFKQDVEISKSRNLEISKSRNPETSTSRNPEIFTSFDPVKWQVILFWWSSLMQQLAHKFPKVFKQQPVEKGKRGKQQRDTPWDFYNRVTATIQKYVGGLSADDVDAQPYGVVLQQLEMMAEEAAEMEKIKKKN